MLVKPVLPLGEAGVAARRRDFDRIQHARLRRVLEIGHVGVPHRLAGAQAADRHAILDHVGHNVDFWMTFDEAPAVLLYRRPVEFTEPAAERDHLVIAEHLAAEQQHEVIEPGAMDGGKVAVADPAQVQPVDFRAQCGTCGCHRDRHASLPELAAATIGVTRWQRTVQEEAPCRTTCSRSCARLVRCDG
jgi:hypothetical protein